MAREILHGMDLFAGLTAPQLDAVAALLRERRCAAGDVIVREGEEGDEMFILREGRVAVSKAIHLEVPGRGAVHFEKQLVVLEAGSYFGEVGLLAADTRSATVKALTPCQLLVLEAAPMQDLMEQDTRLGYHLLRAISKDLCARLRRANEETKKLMMAFAIAINR